MIKKLKEYKGIIKNKKNKFWIYFLNALVLLNIAAGIYFIYSLLLLTGIETVIRTGVIVFSIVMMIVFIICMMNTIIKGKIKFYIIFIIFILISIGAQVFVAYNIDRVHGSLSNINKNTITYTTDLIVMKDSEFETIDDIDDTTIGIINKDKGLEDYTIGQEIIDENKLSDNNEIKEYEDYFEMLNDLYEGEIDGMFVSSNYSIMFGTYEKFANIKDEVKVITSKSKEFKKSSSSNNTVSKNIVKEPFTVLLMGVDSETEGLDKNAAFNGDSLMLITFNPNTLNATVLSIPRDTYVPIMCFKNQKKNKITHAAWYGVDCMQETIENFTGVDIDYYVKMNFKGVVSLVDALGGIDVNVPFKFCEQNSDRAWGNNTICLDTGEQHLDGEQALALARHRKTLALGDIQRGLNQQLVIEGVLKKLTSINSIDQVNQLLDTVSQNMDTNFTTEEILSFYNVAKDILLRSANTTTEDLISMQKLYLDGYTQMIYDESFGMSLSDYIYYNSSLEAVVNAMKVNLGEKEEELQKTFNFSINEVYEQEIIGRGKKDSASTISTLPNFVGSSKSYTQSWCNARNITANFITVSKGDAGYKDYYDDGEVISQSVSQGTEINKVKSITFKVISKTNTEKEDKETDNNNKNDSQTELPITFSAARTTIYLSIGETNPNPAGITVKEGTKDVTNLATITTDKWDYLNPGKYKNIISTVTYKGKSQSYNLTIIVSTSSGGTDPDTDPNPGEPENPDDGEENGDNENNEGNEDNNSNPGNNGQQGIRKFNEVSLFFF